MCAFVRVCVCVPRAVSLCPYVCLSPRCFQNSDEEEVRFCKTRSQEERFKKINKKIMACSLKKKKKIYHPNSALQRID